MRSHARHGAIRVRAQNRPPVHRFVVEKPVGRDGVSLVAAGLRHAGRGLGARALQRAGWPACCAAHRPGLSFQIQSLPSHRFPSTFSWMKLCRELCITKCHLTVFTSLPNGQIVSRWIYTRNCWCWRFWACRTSPVFQSPTWRAPSSARPRIFCWRWARAFV